MSLRSVQEITEVIDDLERWREVRERLTQRNLQRQQPGRRTVLQNDSLSNAIALLMEYRSVQKTILQLAEFDVVINTSESDSSLAKPNPSSSPGQ